MDDPKENDLIPGLKEPDDNENTNGCKNFVWVVDKSKAWVMAFVLERAEDNLTTITVESNHCMDLVSLEQKIRSGPPPPQEARVAIKKRDTHPVDLTHLQNLSNICLMNNMHEAPLLDLLRRRFADKTIYTLSGNVLISLNPYRTISGLYENPLRYLKSEGTALSREEEQEQKRSIVTQDPHVYEIANNSLSDLESAFVHAQQVKDVGTEDANQMHLNQSIIISGESGAGKTENCKHVISFLINANQSKMSVVQAANGEKSDVAAATAKMKALLLQSALLLEAFGNAKTVRNDNSSRFGKYIKLLYSPCVPGSRDQRLCSALTETFLLEKSRLVSVGKDERNYHIFYQLLWGLKKHDPELYEALALDIPIERFTILTMGDCTVVGSVEDDIKNFETTLSALYALEFTDQELCELWSLLACLLHMGSLQCEERVHEFSAHNPWSSDSNNVEMLPATIFCPTVPLGRIAELLGLEENAMKQALTTQQIQAARRSSIRQKILTEQDVRNNIAALLKWIYNRLFSWLVQKINYCNLKLMTEFGNIDTLDLNQFSFIGILDIFGFEILLENSFEQLCINYTNERLQQQFNEHVFITEQAMYKDQGLMWDSISFQDNQEVIDVIGFSKSGTKGPTPKPPGLLHILEEHGMLNRAPDDMALLNSFNQYHLVVGKAPKDRGGREAVFKSSRLAKDGFVVKHFAGEVNYSVKGFLSKNNDSLQDDLMNLLKSSKCEFIRNALHVGKQDTAGPGHVPGPKTRRPSYEASPAKPTAVKKKMASSLTVSQQFRVQLDSLMKTLKNTHPHYIKCVKPNGKKATGIKNLESILVLEQLRYSGVLEVVRIRREGFPVRMTFLEFYALHELLTSGQPEDLFPGPQNCTEEQARHCCDFIASKGLPGGTYQLGHSMIFLQQDSLTLLQIAMTNFLHSKAAAIQKIVRGRTAVKSYMKTKAQIVLLQAKCRGLLGKKKTEKIRKEQFIEHSARLQLILASWFRGLGDRRKYRQTQRAAIVLHSFARMLLGRVTFLRCRFLVILLQSYTRRFLAELQVKRAMAAIVKLQSFSRMVRAHRVTENRIVSLLVIQRAIRGFLFRLRYAHATKAVVVLQSCWRRILAEVLMANRYMAVIHMQSFVRAFLCRMRWLRTLRATLLIQTQFRMYLCFSTYRMILGSVVSIQTQVRGFLARTSVGMKYFAVLTLQSFTRMIIAKRRVKESLAAVVLLQSFIRLSLQRRRFLKTKHAVVLIQSCWRGTVDRAFTNHQYFAILTIQSFARMINAKRMFESYVFAAITVQTAYRQYFARSVFLECRGAAIVLQKFFRGRFARSQVESMYVALITLQSFARMINAKSKYDASVFAVLSLQAFGRMVIARSRFHNIYCSTVTVQSVLRGYMARTRFARNLGAIITLQSFGRMVIGRIRFLDARFACVMVQSFLRMVQHRMRFVYKKAAAILIQSEIRTALARMDYAVQYHAVIILQSFGRMVNAQHFLYSRVLATIRIQSLCRMLIDRNNYFRTHGAVITIQSWYRMLSPKWYLQGIVKFSTLTATLYRGHKAFQRFQLMKRSVNRLYICVRRFLKNVKLFYRLTELHQVCSGNSKKLNTSDDPEVALNLLRDIVRTRPDDMLVRNKWLKYRTVLHSVLLGIDASRVVLKLGTFDSASVIETDIEGHNSLHYLVQSKNPQMQSVVELSAVLNTYRHRRNTPLLGGFDEDEEVEDEGGEGTLADQLHQTLNSDNAASLMSGWVKKKRTGIMWQKRWFVLTEDYLMYYKGPTSKPLFAYPLDGCKVERQAGKEPIIEVTAPNMTEKKTFFGSSRKNCILFLFESESILQEWLLPLRAVAGVEGGLRSTPPPVEYVHTELHRLWVGARDRDGNTALHLLVQNCVNGGIEGYPQVDKDSIPLEEHEVSIEVARIAAWLISRGCPVEAQNDAGDTALHVAVELSASSTKKNKKARVALRELVRCLLSRGGRTCAFEIKNRLGQSVADIVFALDKKSYDAKLLRSIFTAGELKTWPDSPAASVLVHKLKGYSYLSLYIGDCFLPIDLMKQGAQKVAIVVSVFNHQHRLIEEQMVLRDPALLWEDPTIDPLGEINTETSTPQKSKTTGALVLHHWGSMWHMQTPLENLEEGSVVVVELYEEYYGRAEDHSNHNTPSRGSQHASPLEENSVPWVSNYPLDMKTINSSHEPVALSLSQEVGLGSPVKPSRAKLSVDFLIHKLNRPVDKKAVVKSRDFV